MKKTLISIISLILAFITLSADISAEEVVIYAEDDLKEFIELLSEDVWEARRFKNDKWERHTESDGITFTNYELSLLKKEEDYIVIFEHDFDKWERHLKSKGQVPDYEKTSYYYTFILYTSDYKTYLFQEDLVKRNAYTAKELIESSGIPDVSKLVFCETSYHIQPDVKNCTFYKANLGWNTINGADYYINSDGAIQTKSCSIDGIRYSFSADGVCKGRYTGWTKSSKGRRYYKNGELVKNKWLKTKSGKRYYADEKGYVVTGENIIKDKAYLFSDKGILKGGPFELCTVTVTDTETGKVYISHTNGGTWLNDEKAPVYAAAVNGRVPVSSESIAFIIYNESGRSLEHLSDWFEPIKMKYMLDDGSILTKNCTSHIHESGTSYRDGYGLKFYEGIKAGKCVYTKIVGNFEIKVEFMFVQG